MNPCTLRICCLLVLQTCHALGADPASQSVQEDDWSLPDWVRPKPDVIGFYGANPPDVPGQTLKLITQRWSDVNPHEGVFDWSELRRALNKGHSIYYRLENSHVIHCPKWLEQKHPDLNGTYLTGSMDGLNGMITRAGGSNLPLK